MFKYQKVHHDFDVHTLYRMTRPQWYMYMYIIMVIIVWLMRSQCSECILHDDIVSIFLNC